MCSKKYIKKININYLKQHILYTFKKQAVSVKIKTFFNIAIKKTNTVIKRLIVKNYNKEIVWFLKKFAGTNTPQKKGTAAQHFNQT